MGLISLKPPVKPGTSTLVLSMRDKVASELVRAGLAIKVASRVCTPLSRVQAEKRRVTKVSVGLIIN